MSNEEAIFCFLNQFNRRSIHYYFETSFLLVVKVYPLYDQIDRDRRNFTKKTVLLEKFHQALFHI